MWVLVCFAIIGYICCGLYIAGNFAWCFGVSHSSIRPWWSPFLVPSLILAWPVYVLVLVIWLLIEMSSR